MTKAAWCTSCSPISQRSANSSLSLLLLGLVPASPLARGERDTIPRSKTPSHRKLFFSSAAVNCKSTPPGASCRVVTKCGKVQMEFASSCMQFYHQWSFDCHKPKDAVLWHVFCLVLLFKIHVFFPFGLHQRQMINPWCFESSFMRMKWDISHFYWTHQSSAVATFVVMHTPYFERQYILPFFSRILSDSADLRVWEVLSFTRFTLK